MERATAALCRWVLPAAALLAPATGCGLVLDLDPPDQPADAGVRSDAAASDGSLPDAGRADGGPDGGGPPCITDVDCDDGNPCNGRERCTETGCVGGEPVECFDDDPCDGITECVDGECVLTSGPPSCPNDGNPCNGEELCIPTEGCGTTPPPDCDDDIACTVDSCDPDVGCVNAPDDGLCTDGPEGVCDPDRGCQYSVCDATTCLPGPCQAAECVDGLCIRTTLCATGESCCGGTCVPAGCDDADPCTDDHCDPRAAACMHVPNTAPCDDGNMCTGADRCTDGMCVGAVLIGCTDGDPCTADRCEPSVGCVYDPAPEGTPCSDGDACTGGDRCEAGACTPGSAVDCGDDYVCTTDSCDPATGCMNVPMPVGTSCGLNAVCEDTGKCLCKSGWLDCNSDGACECAATTGCGSGGTCLMPAGCADDGDCPTGQLCCLDSSASAYRSCFDSRCLSCCMGTGGGP